MASIQGVYIALFGRPADPTGLAYWNAQTNDGADLSKLMDAMGPEPEALARFANLNPAETVTLIYQSLFGRDPEAEGLAFFVSELESGAQSLETIAINILDGAQGDDACLIDNKIAAANAFTQALDTQEEQDAYSGNSAADVGRTFLTSVTCEEETIPSAAQAQAVINTLLVPDSGQTPVTGTAPGGGTTAAIAPRLDASADNANSASSFKPVLATDLETDDNGFGFTLDPTGTESEFYYNFETAGDINQDGIDDILIGATDSVYLVHGSSTLSGALSLGDFNTSGGPQGTLFTAIGDSAGKMHAVGVGDINGDDLNDMVFSKTSVNRGDGKIYVVYGRDDKDDDGLPATVNLNALNGTDGFVVEGAPRERLGLYVESAGDFNGDGMADIAFVNNSETFVLFGKQGGPNSTGGDHPIFSPTFDHRSLDGTNGLIITSEYDGNTQFGLPVKPAGDINGDGVGDLVLGESSYSSRAPDGVSGLAHVVFGTETPGAAIEVTDLTGSNGFSIAGGWYQISNFSYSGGALGISADGVGDINGDGIDDVIISESGASKGGITSSGAAYVIFGSDAVGAFPAEFDETALDGSNGFALFGDDADSRLGRDVASAGDLNGDGINDFIVSNSNPGTAHIIFGRDTVNGPGFDPVFDFNTLGEEKVGFSLTGENISDRFGYSNDTLGDVNGDGIDDLGILAYTTTHGAGEEGTLYVVFGSDEGVFPGVSIATGTLGFIDPDTTILAEAADIDPAASIITVTPGSGASVGTFHAYIADGTDVGTADASGQIHWTFDPTGVDFAALDFSGGPIVQTYDIAIEQDSVLHVIDTVGITLTDGFETV